MADATQRVDIVATSKGWERVTKLVRAQQDAIDDLARSTREETKETEISARARQELSKGNERIVKSLNALADASRNSASAAKQGTSEWARWAQAVTKFKVESQGAARAAKEAAQGSSGYSNASTQLDQEIKSREEVVRRLQSEIKERDRLATIQGSSAYNNASTQLTQEVKDRQRVIQTLQNEIKERDRLATIQGGRNYNNASVQSDSAIQQREQESKRFAQSLQARMQAEQQATQTTQGLDAASNQMAGNLPRLRYALYDVSTTAAITGAAMTALAVATAKTSITMDREFADVIRTTGTYMDGTGQQTANLRGEFNDLFSTLPKSWADITSIGTLAGQLGIATQDVAEFTSLVAKFASVTDVTVDASATAFGRLSQLLSVSADEYENLGSSILAVGVSSVSTESQIITISSQIASMGDFAGMSADEVIGLSSALASLGVQPELSRGTVTRLFTNLASAVDTGGEKLEAFARTAGMSSDVFAKAWKDDATGAIMSLLQGLDKVDRAGGSAITTLREMGITSVRDVPTMLKLAQNYEFVGEQLQIASDGYRDGTALQEQYGVVAETTAEKLTLLTNHVKLFVGSLGETDGVLATVIEGVTDFVRGLTGIMDNDIAQGITGTVLAITALGGVTLIAAGGLTRFAASGLAVRTALTEVAGASFTAKTGLDATTASTWQLVTASNGLKRALIGTGVGAALVALGTAAAYFIGRSDRASQAAERLSEAIQTDTDSGEGISLATDRVIDYDRVATGVALTQEAWNKVLDGSSTYSREYAAAVEIAADAVREFQGLAGDSTQKELLAMFQDSDAIKDAFQAGFIPEELDFSALTEILIKEGAEGGRRYLDEMFNPDQINAKRAELAAQLGDAISFAGLTEADWNAAGLTTAQQDQLRLYDALNERLDAYRAIMGEVGDTHGAFAKAVEDAAYAQRVLAGETDVARDAAIAAGAEFDELAGDVESATEALFGMLNIQSNLNSALYDLGASVYENGQNFDTFSASGRANLQALEAVFEATAAHAAANGVEFEDAISVVGTAMVQAGVISVEQLQALAGAGINFGNDLLGVAEATSRAVASLQAQMASLQAIPSGMTRGQAADGARYAGQALAIVEHGGAAAEKVMASMGLTFNRLESTGFDVANMLAQVDDGWRNAGDSASKSGGKQSKAAKDAAREVRTLSDYVSDLSSVFSDAFDFRFGFQQSVDASVLAFRSIVQSFEDARQKVKDYNAEIRELRATMGGLRSDINILNYQYSIAVEYDDTMRQEAILAELAKKNNDLAKTETDLQKTQKNLAKARQDANADLSSGTDSAIDQRRAVEDLVKSYEDRIVAYANTGATQQEVEAYARKLRGEFQNQMRQLGYNTREVEKYTGAFNDMIQIIREIPRNITIKVDSNTSPAEKALREFRAKAQKRVTTPVALDTSGARKALSGLRNQAANPITVSIGGSLGAVGGANIGASIANEFVRVVKSKQRGSGGGGGAGNYQMFADGGYTGRGGKYEAAGIVHRGEYVVPKHQVNQATGMPYADAFARLSRGTPAPSYAGGGHVSRMAMPGTMDLSAMTIQQLARALKTELRVDGRVLGEVVSQAQVRKMRAGAN